MTAMKLQRAALTMLIVFLSYDPRGRRLLADSKLTDLDLQTAFILETYGRSEITRRVRLQQQQESESKNEKKEKPAKKEKPVKKGKRQKVDVDPDPTPAPTAAPAPTCMEVDEEVDKVDEAEKASDVSEETLLLEAIDENLREDCRKLATKRRRNNKSIGTSSTSDSFLVIDFWFRALQSTQASVLETLVASSRSTARNAAQSSLLRQAGENNNVASNRTLSGISISTAVKSCEELVRLVHQHPKNIPMIICAETAWDAVSSKPSIGISPIPSISNQKALFACTVLKKNLQPAFGTGILLIHASSIQDIRSKQRMCLTWNL